MLESYRDIRERIKEPPKWFDENGVPRYDDYSPNLDPDVYADECLLVEIACQDCQQRFMVGVSQSRMNLVAILSGQRTVTFRERLRGWEARKDRYSPVHYGDPPRHGCVGDTMNCIDLRVMQFWSRKNDKYQWERVPECEVELEKLE